MADYKDEPYLSRDTFHRAALVLYVLDGDIVVAKDRYGTRGKVSAEGAAHCLGRARDILEHIERRQDERSTSVD